MSSSDCVHIPAPASKSVSHRAVMAASLAVGESVLENVLESQDLMRTMDCLRAAGAVIEQEAPGVYRVQGMNGLPSGGGTEPTLMDVGESGTTCRLLTGILAVGNGAFEIRGAGRMHDRPIGELIEAVTSLGARVRYLEKPNCPPFVMEAAGLRGGTVSIGVDESSQYLSGLLLAAPLARGPLTVETHGRKAVSWPYVGLTLQMMEDFGALPRVQLLVDGQWEPADWRELTEVTPGEVRFPIPLGMYMARHLRVEGDFSNASYFLAAGAAGPGPVRVTGLRPDSLQGDRAILDILGKMGADVQIDPEGVTVSPAELQGVDLDMGRSPDLVPTVAVLASFATSRSVLRNVAHLRIKECDRLEAVAAELGKAGCVCEILEDALIVNPGEPVEGKSLELCSYNDHRLPMSLSLLERRGARVAFDDPSVVAKSFPHFWELWERLR